MAYLLEILPALLNGLTVTLSLFALTIVLSLPLGLILSLGLRGRGGGWPRQIVRRLLQAYVWLFRGTPLLLQLIFVFYGLPVLGIVFGRFDAALFAFVLNYAAYFAEIFRGGFSAIDVSQTEAALVLNLTRRQTLRYVILPQLVRVVLPSIGNELINLVKDSSLVYVIGIGDLLRAGNIAVARDVTLVPYAAVAVIYLLLTFILTIAQQWLERRLNRHS